MIEALELQIERAWDVLTELPSGRARTLFLTRSRRVVIGRSELGWLEIGTYRRSVTLKQLREDVFFVNEQMRGEANG